MKPFTIAIFALLGAASIQSPASALAQAAAAETIMGCTSANDFYGRIGRVHKFGGADGWRTWDAVSGRWYDPCESAVCNVTPGYYEQIEQRPDGQIVMRIDRQNGIVTLDVYSPSNVYRYSGQCQKTSAPVGPKPTF